MFINKENIS